MRYIPYFIIMVPDGLNSRFEFIRDVQLVGIKEEDDPISPFCKPLQDSSEVISSVQCLLLSSQDT